MPETISNLEAVNLIKTSAGKIFSVTFTKKSGEERKMVARLEVTKGVKGTQKTAPDYSSLDMINVYDMQAKGFRVINLNGLKELKIDGKEYLVAKVL